MSINPTNQGRPAGITPGRTESTPVAPAPADDKRSAAVPAAPAHDRAEVSAEARALLEKLGAADGADASLTPERLQEILTRLESGHYGRPEVVDQVARQIVGRLRGETPGA